MNRNHTAARARRGVSSSMASQYSSTAAASDATVDTASALTNVLRNIVAKARIVAGRVGRKPAALGLLHR